VAAECSLINFYTDDGRGRQSDRGTSLQRDTDNFSIPIIVHSLFMNFFVVGYFDVFIILFNKL
jgi:hypothetical protein